MKFTFLFFHISQIPFSLYIRVLFGRLLLLKIFRLSLSSHTLKEQPRVISHYSLARIFPSSANTSRKQILVSFYFKQQNNSFQAGQVFQNMSSCWYSVFWECSLSITLVWNPRTFENLALMQTSARYTTCCIYIAEHSAPKKPEHAIFQKAGSNQPSKSFTRINMGSYSKQATRNCSEFPVVYYTQCWRKCLFILVIVSLNN